MTDTRWNMLPTRAGFALVAVLGPLMAAGETALAQSAEESLARPEHQWLAENFSGPFDWSFIDPKTGDVTATGHGDCEMVYGGLFLRCVHKTAAGKKLGVGVTGFHTDKEKYQWTFYGAGGTAMLHGEGTRDAATETSTVEGKQKIPGSPEFTFRTVTKKLADGEWSYSHYRLDGERPVEMFRARFAYPYNKSD